MKRIAPLKAALILPHSSNGAARPMPARPPFAHMFLLLLWLSIFWPNTALANHHRVLPEQLKAVYIYNLANFYSCPQENEAAKHGALEIAILGDSPVKASLQKLQTSLNKEHKKSFHLVQYEHIEDVRKASPCTILFVDSALSNDFPQIIDLLGNIPVLTVSDSEVFFTQGGMISLVERDGKIRFKINLKMAKEKGLRISSQLLKTAINVSQ